MLCAGGRREKSDKERSKSSSFPLLWIISAHSGPLVLPRKNFRYLLNESNLWDHTDHTGLTMTLTRRWHCLMTVERRTMWSAALKEGGLCPGKRLNLTSELICPENRSRLKSRTRKATRDPGNQSATHVSRTLNLRHTWKDTCFLYAYLHFCIYPKKKMEICRQMEIWTNLRMQFRCVWLLTDVEQAKN